MTEDERKIRAAFDRAVSYLGDNGSDEDCLALIPEIVRLRRLALEAHEARGHALDAVVNRDRRIRALDKRIRAFEDCIAGLEGM